MYFFIHALTKQVRLSLSLRDGLLAIFSSSSLFSREKMSSQKSFVLWLLINYIKKYILVFFIHALTKQVRLSLSLRDGLLAIFSSSSLFSREKMSSQKSFVLWLLINYIKKYILVFFIHALTKQVRLSLSLRDGLLAIFSISSLFSREKMP